MTNTDSTPFMDIVPAISLRENERGVQIGSGWDPQWHQPTDVYATYSDKDFRLGLNAAQTTLGAVATLTGATHKEVARYVGPARRRASEFRFDHDSLGDRIAAVGFRPTRRRADLARDAMVGQSR